MQILLVCAGGYSTSILMNKVTKYAADNNLDVSIEAQGASTDELNADKFDVILVAPQIRYKKDEIAKKTGKPVVVIPPMDYGNGKPQKIIELAESGLKGE
ncbi:MAG: PTS sugar transporter subunit IIB [Erysipelotrichaceae bacterium]|nr:PTS sugar transporter subunit IIB [Erysipelotrichaceae bacterium]